MGQVKKSDESAGREQRVSISTFSTAQVQKKPSGEKLQKLRSTLASIGDSIFTTLSVSSQAGPVVCHTAVLTRQCLSGRVTR